MCFRLYCQNRGSPKVVSTAAATIRQAVALLFDHVVAEQALNPAGLPAPEGLASGREMAAMLLLQDLMNMCAGGLWVRRWQLCAGTCQGQAWCHLASGHRCGRVVKAAKSARPAQAAERCSKGLQWQHWCCAWSAVSRAAGHTPTWLKSPMIGRAFVLDLLEFVLLHRPAAFQTHASFKVLLQSKVGQQQTRPAPLSLDCCAACLSPPCQAARSFSATKTSSETLGCRCCVLHVSLCAVGALPSRPIPDGAGSRGGARSHWGGQAAAALHRGPAAQACAAAARHVPHAHRAAAGGVLQLQVSMDGRVPPCQCHAAATSKCLLPSERQLTDNRNPPTAFAAEGARAVSSN